MAIVTVIKAVQEQKNGRAKLVVAFQGGPDGERAAEIDVDAFASLAEADASLRAARTRQAERVPLAKLLTMGERDIDATAPSLPTMPSAEQIAFFDALSALRRALDKVALGIVAADAQEVSALREAALAAYKSDFVGL